MAKAESVLEAKHLFRERFPALDKIKEGITKSEITTETDVLDKLDKWAHSFPEGTGRRHSHCRPQMA